MPRTSGYFITIQIYIHAVRWGDGEGGGLLHVHVLDVAVKKLYQVLLRGYVILASTIYRPAGVYQCR